MKQLNENSEVECAEYVRIVFDRTCIERIFSEEYNSPLTFQKALQIALENGWSGSGIILLIAESALEGKVYQYGNHGDFWTEHGSTRGYA